MRISDWSSDVCSSDLGGIVLGALARDRRIERRAECVEPRAAARGEAHAGVARVQRLDKARQHHVGARDVSPQQGDRSEEHTSELQSLMRISYAVFCLKKKKT